MRSRWSALSSSAVAAAFVGVLGLGSAPALAQSKAAKPASTKPLTDKQKKDLVKKVFADAETKFAAGDYANAIEFYKQADELFPGGKPKYQIAKSYDKLNKVQEAITAYQVFLDSH